MSQNKPKALALTANVNIVVPKHILVNINVAPNIFDFKGFSSTFFSVLSEGLSRGISLWVSWWRLSWCSVSNSGPVSPSFLLYPITWLILFVDIFNFSNCFIIFLIRYYYF